MKLARLSVVSAVILSIFACAGGGETPEEAPAAEPAAEAEEAAAAPSKAPEPGTLPVEFPTMATSLSAGTKVFAPKRSEWEEGFSDTHATLALYVGTLKEVGPVESTVDIDGTVGAVPNSLLFGLPAAPTAAVGDVVVALNGWNLERMRVTSAPGAEPRVTCLDVDPEYACKDRPLPAGAFFPLGAAGSVGSTVACKKGDEFQRGVLLNQSGGRVLVAGFANALTAYAADTCHALDPKPALQKGDKVKVAVVGKYIDGVILTGPDGDGRVEVEYTWVDKKTGSFASHDVALTLEPLGLPAEGAAPAPAKEEPPAKAEASPKAETAKAKREFRPDFKKPITTTRDPKSRNKAN
jgi:hypothetical protein